MTNVSPKGQILTRLLNKLDFSGNCWEWTGYLGGKDGRGYISVDNKDWLAYRLSYELLVGHIPDGVFVLHACDNPKCCRPSHLFLGNQSDNMRDAYRKGRRTNKGINNPRAKITPDIVREIRNRYPIEGGAVLAREFGLDRTQPFRIYNRITWGSVL